MAILVKCKCGTTFSVPDDYAGKMGACKKCGGILQIPKKEQAKPNISTRPKESETKKLGAKKPALQRPKSIPADERPRSRYSYKPSSSKRPIVIALGVACAAAVIVGLLLFLSQSPYDRGYGLGIDAGNKMMEAMNETSGEDGIPNPAALAEKVKLIIAGIKKVELDYKNDRDAHKEFLSGFFQGMKKSYQSHTGEQLGLDINKLLGNM